MPKRTVLLVGAGKMGGALLSGWLKSEILSADELVILDPSPGKDAQQAIAAGAKHITAPGRGLSAIKTILLAIKPQGFDAIAPALADSIPDKALIISILAGTSLARLHDSFTTQSIVRAMPNTPAAIGKGVIAYAAATNVTSRQIQTTQDLLGSSGDVYAVANEHLIDVVTAISGSGPAYLFHMVEALEAAAVHIGLPAELASDFARKTITGSAALLEHSDETATTLRQNVTSPGGTTEAALDVLMGTPGLPSLMRETAAAALKRAKDLA